MCIINEERAQALKDRDSEQDTVNMTAGVAPPVPVIMLNINGLNSSCKNLLAKLARESLLWSILVPFIWTLDFHEQVIP